MDAARDVVAFADVTKVPTYQCYYGGQLVDSYEGTAPSAMREFVDRNIKDHLGSGMALWQKLIVVAAAVAGAGLAYVFAQGDQSTESIAQNARSEILSIKQRIVTAQGRLKNLEKANRGKQAKVQRKLIEQLNAQRRALERTICNILRRIRFEPILQSRLGATPWRAVMLAAGPTCGPGGHSAGGAPRLRCGSGAAHWWVEVTGLMAPVRRPREANTSTSSANRPHSLSTESGDGGAPAPKARNEATSFLRSSDVMTATTDIGRIYYLTRLPNSNHCSKYDS